MTTGEGATPVTEGYAYLLYTEGVYDRVTNTSFASAAMPGATSDEVLSFEVPLATRAGFLARPPVSITPNPPLRVITMTAGGNDLLSLLNNPNRTPADVTQTLQTFGGNLTSILASLCQFPNIRIYVGNLYDIRNFPVLITDIVLAFNKTVSTVVNAVNNGTIRPGNVKVADVYFAFLGDQRNLLLINRKGADKFEVHPSNAGYRAIAQAFIAAK